MQFDRAHSVMYDGLYTFFVRLLGMVLMIGLGVLTARVLGPAGRGTYVLPGVEAALVGSAFGGLTGATSYFLLNRSPARGFLGKVFSCAALLVAAGALCVVGLALLARQPFTAIPAIAVLPALAAVNIAMGFAVGVKQVRYSATIATSQSALTILALFIAFALLSRTPAVAIAAWVCGTTAAGVVAIAYVLVSSSRLNGQDRVSFSEYARFCLKVGLVNIVTLLNYRADLYIVAMFLSAAALGMYTIAVAGAESLLLPTQVAALVTSPHIGSMDLKGAGVLTARCVRHNLLLAAAVCALLFVLARPIVDLLYGPSFDALVPAFNVLLVGVFVLSLASPIANYFTLKLGRPQVALWLSLLSAVVCISTTVVVIGRLGMVGAAIGSSAGYVAGQAMALWYFLKISRVGARALLVPTADDFAVYRGFASRVLRDGRRLLRPAP